MASEYQSVGKYAFHKYLVSLSSSSPGHEGRLNPPATRAPLISVKDQDLRQDGITRRRLQKDQSAGTSPKS